jgi:hypothetical protein
LPQDAAFVVLCVALRPMEGSVSRVACSPGTRIGGGVGFPFGLRLAGVVALCLSLATPFARAESVTLVDFGGDAAVFAIGDRLVAVRRDELVPGVEARLRHVGRDQVLLDFPPAGARGPVTVELKRNSLVSPPASGVERIVPVPAAVAREARTRSASPKRDPP